VRGLALVAVLAAVAVPVALAANGGIVRPFPPAFEQSIVAKVAARAAATR
jgi:hypothetical protein